MIREIIPKTIQKATELNVVRREDMKIQKLKGIWIPIEIITDEKLSDKEVIVL